jgi:hypothetical protein
VIIYLSVNDSEFIVEVSALSGSIYEKKKQLLLLDIATLYDETYRFIHALLL